MRYEGTIYRPPSEAYSLLIQATIGCPHNKCTFCALYKNTKFKIRSVKDIKEDLASAREYYGKFIESLFFPDGNTIIMKTAQLEEIFSYARQLFPYLKRITVYGSARFVNKKSTNELRRLKEAGLSRIHTGMESGDDVILAQVQKGTNAAEIISAGQKLKETGIEVSEYFLTGLGGLERTVEHAVNSAKVLSSFSPDFIRIRTLIPAKGTPLYQDYKSGKFKLLSAHQALREVKMLIENLECDNSIVASDHINNYWNVQGLLPRDKSKMLKELEKALSIDETQYRPPHLGTF